MKILEEKRSPNPRRVRIFLAEKGIEASYEQIDIMKMEHKTEELASLNPFQRVPILVLDDGTAISETMAICRYFEELHPEPNLFGSSPLEIATIEMWSRQAEFYLLFPVAQCFRHGHPAMAVMENPQVPEWAEANKPRVMEAVAIFDKTLKDRQFVAGDKFSVADITAYIGANFMKPARLPIPDEAIHFKRWYAEIGERPSVSA